MVLKCFLTGCLFVSRESKNQQLYSGEIGQHLDWEIKIVITSERQMDVRDLQMQYPEKEITPPVQNSS